MSKQPSPDDLRGWLLAQEPEELVSRLMDIAETHPEVNQGLSEEWQLCHGDPEALVEAAVSAVIDAALNKPLPVCDEGEAPAPLEIGDEADPPRLDVAWTGDLPRKDWAKVADQLEAGLAQTRDDPGHSEERSELLSHLTRILVHAERGEDAPDLPTPEPVLSAPPGSRKPG
jgi:hypothetical protein